MFLPFFVGLLSLTSCGPKIPAASYKLELDNKYQLQLNDFRFPSGLRVLFQSEKSQPIIAITTAIDRGSEFDPKGMEGIAHIVEHLAFRAKHGDIKNWDLIEGMGGTINASTSNDWTNYMTIAPKDAMVPLLRIEALRLKNGVANITKQDVITESEIARNEKRMRYEGAIGDAWDAIATALYPKEHAYGRSTIGSHESIGNITLDAVNQFVKDNYRPEYSTIVVVGDFESKDASRILFDAFAGNEDLLMSPADAKIYGGIQNKLHQLLRKKLSPTDVSKFNSLRDGKEIQAFLKAKMKLADGNKVIELTNESYKFMSKWMPKLGTHLQTMGAKPFPPRVKCGERTEPPPPQITKTQRVKGMVDNETVILAWSLPGGYCDDQFTMAMAASNLNNYVYRALNPQWNWAQMESEIAGFGCYFQPSEYYSQVMCYIEPSDSLSKRMTSKRLIEKAKGALVQQWQKVNPSSVQDLFANWSYGYARAGGLVDVLSSVDEVSSLGGRATQTAMYTHFTGDARYFSSNMEKINKVNKAEVMKIAEKYITRDRAISVIVEPMDEEERERLEAKANAASRTEEVQYHATQAEDRYKTVRKADEITPKFIREQMVTPDLGKLSNFTLANGLKVSVLPYGSTPIVRATLVAQGDARTADHIGMDSLAESSVTRSRRSKERLLAVAGFVSSAGSRIMGSASAKNIDALLHKMRYMVEDVDFANGNERRLMLKRDLNQVKRMSSYAATWADRYRMQALFPDHPLGEWLSPSDYKEMQKWPTEDIQNWINRKWQPKNLELFIVGQVDAQNVEAAVRKYFDGYMYQGKEQQDVIGYMPKPTKLPERQVLIFDKPTATQTDITLMCQLELIPGSEGRVKARILGDVISEMAWRRLREEKGVTYGAGAAGRGYRGGTAYLVISSLVQNDAAGLAVSSMFEFIQRGKKADVSNASIANHKWTRARQYVLGQQSGRQMLSRISSMGYKNLGENAFDILPEYYGNVQKEDFPKMMKPCEGHEVVTLVGPKDRATKLLDKNKIKYKIVDWESEYVKMLSPKELKKYKAAKKAKMATK